MVGILHAITRDKTSIRFGDMNSTFETSDWIKISTEVANIIKITPAYRTNAVIDVGIDNKLITTIALIKEAPTTSFTQKSAVSANGVVEPITKGCALNGACVAVTSLVGHVDLNNINSIIDTIYEENIKRLVKEIKV